MGLVKLDTQDFASLFQRAKELYEHVAKESLRDSDPVFTMLETQVMLVDMLNYYMESITAKQKEQHYSMIHTHVPEIKQHIYLYLQSSYVMENHKNSVYDKELFTFLKEEDVYYAEAMHGYTLFPFDVCYAVMVQQGTAIPIQRMLDNHATCYHSHPLQEQDTLYLCVEKQLPLQEMLYLTILCDSSKRNQKGNPQLFQKDWKWEYYSMHGWQELTVSDDTCGLRYTGEVSFQIHKHMDKTTLFEKQGFWIRIVKLHVMEQACLHISDIRFHYILCKPGMTLAMSQEVVNTSAITLMSAFDSHAIFGKQKDAMEWNQCKERIQRINGNEVSIPQQSYAMYRIVYHREQLKAAVETFSITGTSCQHIALSPAKQPRIALQMEGQLVDCPIYPDQQGSNLMGAVWEEDGLRFGNGRDFLIPKANAQLMILEMLKDGTWKTENLCTFKAQNKGCTLCQIESLEEQGYQEALLSNAQVKHFVETLKGCMFRTVEVLDAPYGYDIKVQGIHEHAFDPLWLQSVEKLIEQALCFGSKAVLVEMM